MDSSIYAWEKSSARLWEGVGEDGEGNLLSKASLDTSDKRLSHTHTTGSIRRGVIRYVVLAIDASLSSAENDYRPTRLEACKAAVSSFVAMFFDQNPISQLSLQAGRDRVAEKLTHMSASAMNHVNKLKTLTKPEGVASIQNLIRMAIVTLKHIPEYGQREVLILFNSLSTCDPEDIFKTIQEAKDLHIKISVICLAAEVFICRRITEMTGGVFAVALSQSHLNELVNIHTTPLPKDESEGNSNSTQFLYVGFPRKTIEEHALLCFDGSMVKHVRSSYQCPRCSTRTTQLPAQCSVCQLQMNSSAHVARSHHHLFPVPQFTPIPPNEYVSTAPCMCYGCCTQVSDDACFACPDCGNVFCSDCDVFVHDLLHNCPGCV